MFKLNKKQVLNILKAWLPLAIVTTCLSGLIYLSVQQNIRISANDPQIQIAEDIAAQLTKGQDPRAFVPSTTTELSKSLATYIMLFDKDGKLVGSSVTLDGKNPVVPQGVFSQTQKSLTGETRFTWQPKPGVRSAVVVDYYKGPVPGFVLIGRSIREIEIREKQQEYIVFLGWAVTMLVSLLAVSALSKLK
jgi:hypothetical protein